MKLFRFDQMFKGTVCGSLQRSQVDSLEDLMGPLPIDYFDGQSTESICLSEFAKECEEIYEKENGAVESDE